jgi:hypothetical protein
MVVLEVVGFVELPPLGHSADNVLQGAGAVMQICEQRCTICKQGE